MTASALSGIVGPTHWQRTAPHFSETVRPMARQARLRSTLLDAAHLHATQRNGKPSGRLLRVRIASPTEPVITKQTNLRLPLASFTDVIARLAVLAWFALVA